MKNIGLIPPPDGAAWWKPLSALLLFMWVFFIIVPSSLYSLENKNVRFQRFSVEDGLPQPSVTSIIQDPEGFLWFGTFEGLCRFDGFNFKVYTHDDKTPASLGGNHISTLFLDQKGNLWIGARAGGLSRYVRETDSFTVYRRDPKNPRQISSNSIYKILEDVDGVFWIATGYGLNRFDPANNSFETFFPESSGVEKKNPYLSLMVSMIADGEDILWIGAMSGLLKFSKKSRKFDVIPLPSTPLNMGSPSEIHSLFMDRGRILWVGTGGGVFQLDCRTGLFASQPLNLRFHPSEIFSKAVLSSFQDQREALWLGTVEGVFIIDKNRDRYQWRHMELDNPNSLSNNFVQAIYEDNVGNIWLGTNGGVTRITNANRRFRHFLPDGKVDSSVLSLAEDSNGVLWVGSSGRGLFKCNLENGDTSVFVNDIQNPASLINNCVISLYRDKTGVLWVGTGNGLCRMDKKKEGVFRCFPPQPGVPGRLDENIISVIYEDAVHDFWIGTPNGLFRMNRENEDFECFRDNTGETPMNGVTSILETSSGDLWFTYWGGGYKRFNRKNNTFETFSLSPSSPRATARHDLILSSHADKNGNLWLGTFDRGLYKCDAEGTIIKNYSAADGLANNTVCAILEDGKGFLWMSSYKGLTRFDPRRESCRTFDPRDGLQAYEFNSLSACRGAGGRLYFGGVSGFNAFFPDDIRDNGHIPPIFITGVRLSASPLEIIPKGKNGKPAPVELAEKLEVTPEHNMISLEFAALDFRMPERNRYRYTLDGFIDGWLDLGARREVVFTNLDPGRYVFRVKGSNNDGVWNETGKSLVIVILPPFYRTLWFRLLVVVLLGAMVYLLYRRRMKTMVKRLEGRMRLDYLYSQYGLSAREQEILELLLKGKNGSDIEKELYISIKTVRTHIYNIYKKVGVKNRVELMTRFQKETGAAPLTPEEC